jgi:hypothetical protein
LLSGSATSGEPFPAPVAEVFGTGEQDSADVFRGSPGGPHEDRLAARHLESARFEATRDPLPGLANRKELQQCLAATAGSDDGQAAIVFVDLDHFKTVNDTSGHLIGDPVELSADGLSATLRS